MLKKILHLVLAISALQSASGLPKANAEEYGCTLAPAEIPIKGTELLKQKRAQGKPFPNRKNVRTSMDLTFGKTADPVPTENNQVLGTYEGYLRPLEDMTYSYFGFPFLEFQLNRHRNLIYVCGHGDADPSRTHITLYVLSGYGMDPWRWSTPLEDYFHEPELEFSKVQVQFLGVRSKIPLFPILEQIPILGQIVQIPDTILDKLNTALGQALTATAGAHVQRVVLTTSYVELDSWFDPKDPEKADRFFRFDFKSGQVEMGDER